MKVGSKVRVIGIPEGLEAYPDFPSKFTFICALAANNDREINAD
jgi:hypothetical protein